MGLMRLLNSWRNRWRGRGGRRPLGSANPRRKCELEKCEPRQLFDADPIRIGVVYTEGDTGADHHGDTFEVTFRGGAPGTQLNRLVIDGDHFAQGLSFGDMIFDTVKGGLGADEAIPFRVISANGIGSVRATVEDGSSKLVLDFQGFEAGEKLVFEIDVDEIQQFDPNETNLSRINEGIDPIASGVEFQGSHLTGTFSAPHYYDVSGTGEFRNLYDAIFAGTGLEQGPTNPNGLPADDKNGLRDRTTGGLCRLEQKPLPIAIGGTVFVDPNLDLVRQPGELGLGGVTLSLWKNTNGVYVDTGLRAQTDANGAYKFGFDLKLDPGVYQVRETQPSGYFSVGAAPGTVNGTRTGSAVQGNPDVLTEIAIPLGGSEGREYNFAEALPSKLSGYVYVDANNNGIRDAGEVGLKNVPIRIIPVTSIAPQSEILVRTNDSGYYEGSGLAPGTYRIVETEQPAGYFDGIDRAGTINGQTVGFAINPGDQIHDIRLGGGQTGIDYDFGETPPGSLRGKVKVTNRDGDCDGPGSRGLANVVIHLVCEDGTILATTRTNANGEYEFTNLLARTYAIVEEQPTGLFDGDDHVGTIDGVLVGRAEGRDVISGIDLLPGQNGINYDFCESEPSSLSGFVYHDQNLNGRRDGAEQIIAGVTVALVDANGLTIATKQTGADGAYSFANIPAGVYRIVETQPSGWLQGPVNPGRIAGNIVGVAGADVISQIDVKWGDHGEEYDFGEILPGGISGKVYADRNRDCVHDEDEPLLEGVTIRLLDSSGRQIAQTITDAQGQYRFQNLPPGEYTLAEDQPEGYLQGSQMAGSGGGDASQPDRISKILVGSGMSLVNYDFCEIEPSSISGRVFVDQIRNSIYNAGEPTLSGVRITLYDSAGHLVAETLTDSDGYYRFEGLTPGTYLVREDQPSGYFHGGQTVGTGSGDASVDDVISQIVVEGGDQLFDYNFFELAPSSLAGVVFRDGDVFVTLNGQLPSNYLSLRDGILKPGDLRIAGVTLELRDSVTGRPIMGSEALPGYYGAGPIRAVTDSQGRYEFRGLRGGSYAILEVQPEGYFDGIDRPGTALGLAINPNTTGASGAELPFLLAGVPLRNDAILQIQLGYGFDAIDYNFSELQATPQFVPSPLPQQVPFAPSLNPPIFVQPLAPTTPPFPQILRRQDEEFYGGTPIQPTWHLSVINAGKPRGNYRNFRVENAARTKRPYLLDHLRWDSSSFRDGHWHLPSAKLDQETPVAKGVLPEFGHAAAVPLAGDFNGDGASELALFVDGEWFIDMNGNHEWDDNDLWASLGGRGDQPVVGDWDGDGKSDIGIFGPQWPKDWLALSAEPGLPDPENRPTLRPKNLPPEPEEATDGERWLQLSSEGDRTADLIDHVFVFGEGQEKAIVGDWNGDGIDSIGVFKDGKWRLDEDGDGKLSENDLVAQFGEKGDIPLVGDFDGDGLDDLAVFRAGEVIIDSNGNRKIDPADKRILIGSPGDTPVVGDFDADGIDEVAVYRHGQAPPADRVTRRQGDDPK